MSFVISPQHQLHYLTKCISYLHVNNWNKNNFSFRQHGKTQLAALAVRRKGRVEQNCPSTPRSQGCTRCLCKRCPLKITGLETFSTQPVTASSGIYMRKNTQRQNPCKENQLETR